MSAAAARCSMKCLARTLSRSLHNRPPATEDAIVKEKCESRLHEAEAKDSEASSIVWSLVKERGAMTEEEKQKLGWAWEKYWSSFQIIMSSIRFSVRLIQRQLESSSSSDSEFVPPQTQAKRWWQTRISSTLFEFAHKMYRYFVYLFG